MDALMQTLERRTGRSRIDCQLNAGYGIPKLGTSCLLVRHLRDEGDQTVLVRVLRESRSLEPRDHLVTTCLEASGFHV